MDTGLHHGKRRSEARVSNCMTWSISEATRRRSDVLDLRLELCGSQWLSVDDAVDTLHAVPAVPARVRVR